MQIDVGKSKSCVTTTKLFAVRKVIMSVSRVVGWPTADQCTASHPESWKRPSHFGESFISTSSFMHGVALLDGRRRATEPNAAPEAHPRATIGIFREVFR